MAGERLSPSAMRTRWILAVIGAAVVITGAAQLGNVLTPTGHTYPWNPFTLLIALATGTPLPIAGGALLVVGAIAVAVLWWRVLPKRARARTDRAARHMGSQTDTRVLRGRARTEEAVQLHPDAPEIGPGQRIGVQIGAEQPVYQGWRDLGVHVWAPGRGKTSSMVIRHVADAPGAAVVTSNKVDGVKEITAARTSPGQEVFLFDPQRIYRSDGKPGFTFDPLSMVRTLTDAQELAEIFEASTKVPGTRGGDPQFDPAGRGLLANFLLAAALDRKPLQDVFDWLTSKRGDVPQAILTRHGKTGSAAAVAGVLSDPSKTAGGVFATAQRMAAALQDDDLLAWTRHTPGGRVFDPATFIDSRDTLVLLSKEGAGSGGAILTALVRAICKTAETAAQRRGGRLQTPLVMELDECANIVRWPELPSVYSFYGSLGIQISTYFQSYAQGVGVFSKGMDTLWNAATIRVYGGGSDDVEWLRKLSALIGDRDETIYNTSRSRGHASQTSSTRRRPILSVDELASLPEWRAIVFSSKAPPVQVEVQPWFRDPALTARINPPAPDTEDAS